MALKFLNKKGWHTGSLRNIENVWKAEQKHDAEQKKLEELRKQIQEERERSEFRLLQEQAGLVPKQERLDFLYDSGLAVGKGGSDGFRELEAFPKPEKEVASSSSAKASMPGALFEEKPQSANDAWRKLHSDPLLMIRQREQEALARVRNNPIQMAVIRKSVEEKKHNEKTCKRKEEKKLRERKSKHHRHASPLKQPCDTHNGTRQVSKHTTAKFNDRLSKARPDAEGDFSKRESRKNHDDKDLRNKRRPSSKMTVHSDSHERNRRNFQKAKHDEYPCDSRANFMAAGKNFYKASSSSILAEDLECELHYKRRNAAPKLSEEERVARLREMQADAELHEEQRCKRLRKAEEDDVLEVTQAGMSGGRNFLDAAQTRVYGAEEGGSSTIEESVRRRTHYLQGKSEANAGNAFRR